ncbi:MAG: flagellar export protein FliJ [Thermodesulfobacteriota bacterium]
MFRFKLEFLLRYRRQIEETAMYELAQRIREANEIEAELYDVRERRVELAAQVKGKAALVMPAALFNLYKDHQDYLYRRGKMMEKGLALAERRIEKQRQKLVQTSVDRKTIELYKEKQREAHLEKEARREQNELSELAALVLARKRYEET